MSKCWTILGILDEPESEWGPEDFWFVGTYLDEEFAEAHTAELNELAEEYSRLLNLPAEEFGDVGGENENRLEELRDLITKRDPRVVLGELDGGPQTRYAYYVSDLIIPK